MPLLFVLVGTLFLITAISGKEKVNELTDLLKSDFTGPNNFWLWGMAIAMVAALGYIKTLKPLSNIFLVLLAISILLNSRKNGKDFFSMFMEQIRSTESKG